MAITHGDCLEEMRKMEDNTISAIVTDPPYGLKFMGKEWDHGIPGTPFWQEALRICKPGAHLLAFGGTRTFHRLTCAIEDAGWQIRDCLMWLYGTGFPKSHNHFGIEGYGTALKPSWEPIIMAMKPCDGTFMQNVEKWGQGGINIDGCRIGIQGATKRSHQAAYPKNEDGKEDRTQHWGRTGHEVEVLNKGRWPANLILDEEAGKMVDEQSGILKSGGGDKGNKTQDGGYGKKYGYVERICEPSTGGASRFFYCPKASTAERNAGLEELPLKKLAGVYGEFAGDGRGRETEHSPQRNNHTTVKPLKLMEYLIKLVMPPKDGILLDPFAGSGTTVLAAKNIGVKAVGIEKQEEYVEIANKRCSYGHQF